MSASDWRQILREASAQAIEQTGRGLLLSQVPSVLKHAGLDPVEILGRRKLLEFLREEHAGEFQLVQNELDRSLWALLPPQLTPTLPHSQYFVSASDPKPSDVIPRFIPLFWQGFQRPLPPGYRRWLFTEPAIHFQDRPEGDEVSNAVEIEREFVRDETALFTTNEVSFAKVQDWAAKQGRDLREFLVTLKTSTPGHMVSGKPLEAFLKALRPEEQTRISLPADIVARLLGL